MKINIEGRPPIIIGKRISLGAAILSTASAIAHFYPDQAAAIIFIATPITFFAQLLVVRFCGVTT